MTPLMMPFRTSLIPAVRYPVVTAALVNIAARNPDVRAMAPLPIARRPSCVDPRAASVGRRRIRGAAVRRQVIDQSEEYGVMASSLRVGNMVMLRMTGRRQAN